MKGRRPSVWCPVVTTVWLAALSPGYVGAAFAGEEPFVDLSFDAACKRAGEEGKAVFVDFYTDWCTPCKLMDRTVFVDDEVNAWILAHTVPLKVNAERQQALAGRYRVSAYPTLLYVKPDGAEIDRIVGAPNKEQFLRASKEIVGKEEAVSQALEGVDQGAGRPDGLQTGLQTDLQTGEDPLMLLSSARTLTRAGRKDEALTAYLRCLDSDRTGLTVQGLYMVLLMEISQIGSTYPKAMDALRERQAKMEQTIEQSAASGADVNPLQVSQLVSLNHVLKRDEGNLALYDRLRAANPDSSAVAFLRTIVFVQLVEARRYAELADGVDFAAEVDEQVKMNEASLGMSPESQRAANAKLQNEMLVEKIGAYYQILLGLGRTDDAAKMATRAIEIDPSPNTYALLARNGYESGTAVEANVEQARKALASAGGNDFDAVSLLARLLHATGRAQEGCELLQGKHAAATLWRDKTLLRDTAGDLDCQF